MGPKKITKAIGDEKPAAPPPKAAKGKAGKKDGKKSVEKVAVDQPWQQEKDQVCGEEDRERLEIELSQQVLRKECKLTKRKTIHKLLTDQDKEIRALHAQMHETSKITGIQLVKLEDELARMSMSKQVVTQELNAAQAELAKLKGDDGSKALISHLRAQIETMEDEGKQKVKDLEAIIEELNQKLAKQITDNRLMRIQAIDSEAEWGRRVQNLENDLREALQTLMTAKDEADPQKVAGFMQAVDRSKEEYLRALRQAQETIIGMTDGLVDLKSMHSNLPNRIRAALQEQSKEELLLIIDSLSFEEGVLHYLEYQFPRA